MGDVINLKHDVITPNTFNRSLLLEEQNFKIRKNENTPKKTEKTPKKQPIKCTSNHMTQSD